MQALSVCTAGLRCLRATTLALELDEYQVEPFVAKPADVTPPDPLTPKLLPSVHLLWTPLMGALKVGNEALVGGRVGRTRGWVAWMLVE